MTTDVGDFPEQQCQTADNTRKHPASALLTTSSRVVFCAFIHFKENNLINRISISSTASSDGELMSYALS